MSVQKPPHLHAFPDQVRESIFLASLYDFMSIGMILTFNDGRRHEVKTSGST